MVHKPKHKVHSFRGLLGDGGQDEINLERQNVNLAYRIIKFQIIPPGAPSAPDAQDSIVQVWREKVVTIPTSSETIDFTNPNLLAAAIGIFGGISSNVTPFVEVIVFDNTLFSRNIYVTHTDNEDTKSMNYYLELEEVPVGAATLMQLKLGTARKLIGAKMGG